MTCDICNAEADGAVVPWREFQRVVAAGRFDPIRLGLAAGRASHTDAENFAFWAGVVRENETDWFLCHSCHRAYRETTAVSAPPTRAAGDDFPDSLETLRRLHPLPAPPAVPADWRPGLMAGIFGRGKPWGDSDQAVALIRHGRIAEARELLLRLVAHRPGDLPAKLLLCLESRRPPRDEALKPSTIVPFLPAKERAAVDALFGFTQLDYDWLQNGLVDAIAQPPDSEPGAFHLLLAFVAGADLWFQTQILYPRKGAMESAIVTKPNKGLALLLERRHDEAWQILGEGAAEPESIIDTYRKICTDLSSEEAKRLVRAMRGYCEIGRGLVLFDLGYEAERRSLFRQIVTTFTGPVADACRLLA
jgi:hypothetical protein